MFKIAIICGGPSPERGISLNSARSLLDHLASETIEICPLYVDSQKNFYAISSAQLYSNTPSDFDFKLSSTAKALNQDELTQFLKQVDLVFPVIHGLFGEDGQLQTLLENLKIPFVGSNSVSSQLMYDKHKAKAFLKEHHFPVLPSIMLTPEKHDLNLIHDFFAQHHLEKAIIKPTFGGSSIGVFVVATPQQALEKCQSLFQQGHANVLLESYCQGREFTIIVFENLVGEPVALIPTEVEMDYSNNQIFDYRKKYLATNQVTYHTPPRFEEKIIQQIRQQAESAFKVFRMHDFVRLDGWLLPDQQICFTDINPIAGMEQNSFLFRQASLVGLTHQQALYMIIKRACQRFELTCPELSQKTLDQRAPVYVLFGGKNAERQVSLMSGTNIWLKLLRSSNYLPLPFFYDKEGHIWELPYSYTLDHSVEEIYHNCLNAKRKKEPHLSLITPIQCALGMDQQFSPLPLRLTLEEFLKRAQSEQAFVFIAMHGGDGENGTLQYLLEQHQIPYNGSDSQTSALCMDKYLSGEVIRRLEHPTIRSLPKRSLNFSSFIGNPEAVEQIWHQLISELGMQQVIIKPRCDGCSAGIVLLRSLSDFKQYISLIHQNVKVIPANSFPNQKETVEMPSSFEQEFLIEPYIETDSITIQQNRLRHTSKEGWIELTVGVLEEDGNYHALNPSIAIAEGAVLSLEEKFQGGTGVNLTPPPEFLISQLAVVKIRQSIEKIAEALKIQNYARIDIFFNRLSEQLIFIEANTLPGLTPSTVFYHQGLAEKPALSPTILLEKIIASKLSSYQILTC